jgi:hypothetical protein
MTRIPTQMTNSYEPLAVTIARVDPDLKPQINDLPMDSDEIIITLEELMVELSDRNLQWLENQDVPNRIRCLSHRWGYVNKVLSMYIGANTVAAIRTINRTELEFFLSQKLDDETLSELYKSIAVRQQYFMDKVSAAKGVLTDEFGTYYGYSCHGGDCWTSVPFDSCKILPTCWMDIENLTTHEHIWINELTIDLANHSILEPRFPEIDGINPYGTSIVHFFRHFMPRTLDPLYDIPKEVYQQLVGIDEKTFQQ